MFVLLSHTVKHSGSFVSGQMNKPVIIGGMKVPLYKRAQHALWEILGTLPRETLTTELTVI